MLVKMLVNKLKEAEELKEAIAETERIKHRIDKERLVVLKTLESLDVKMKTIEKDLERFFLNVEVKQLNEEK